MTTRFGESILQTLISTVIAFIIMILLIPAFERLTGIEITEGKIVSVRNIIAVTVLMVITGFLAGTYPALILSSFKPVKVLRPSVNNNLEGAGLRKALVIFQFVLTIIFIFSISVINRQIHFLQNKKLGFNKDEVMVIYFSQPTETESGYTALMSEIENIPGVKAASMGGNAPVNLGNINTFSKWEGNVTEKSLKFHMIQVDDNYLNLLGMELVSGRQFYRGSISNEIIINQTAARQMDMEEPLGKWIDLNGEKYTIVGIVRDFYFRKLDEDINPVVGENF